MKQVYIFYIQINIYHQKLELCDQRQTMMHQSNSFLLNNSKTYKVSSELFIFITNKYLVVPILKYLSVL